MTPEQRIHHLLSFLYGDWAAGPIWSRLKARLDDFRERHPQFLANVRPPAQRLTERDAILITYGDQFSEPGRASLATLRDFLHAHLSDVISGVHILPCFPYSSDDGFSVIDYRQIDPALGTWDDINALGRDFRLMLDAVINHISRESTWFQGFLHDQPPYTDYFIVVEPDTDLSMVVRPRALPLLTAVKTASGTRHVWTTFSEDQIDLNYANPQVLLEITDVLLHYVAHGAEIIRLDAIAYLWKEIGTPCIHLTQTHAVVKLWRAVLDAVAPGVLLITETNVPHEENISYFGDYLPETSSTDEAQMVYNFPLAPLVLHALDTGDVTRLATWAETLRTPTPEATFFNFIASHDGIGVMPARGILTEAEVQALVDRTLAHGGQVSYKANSDGSQSVYELNITLYDFLNDPANPDPALDVPRFLASQAVLLSLAGVPGIYVHSLFGSRNCHACYARTGRARSLNREKFQRSALEAALRDPGTRQHQVFEGYRRLLRIRRQHPAFHPAGSQRVLLLNNAVFTLERVSPSGGETILCLVNVAPQRQSIGIDLAAHGLPTDRSWRDLVGDRLLMLSGRQARIELTPYQVCWLMGE